jgi:hypothetical protein
MATSVLTAIPTIPNRCNILGHCTWPGRLYRIRHGPSTVTAVHARMSVTRESGRDVSRGCIRYIRDHGHVIASSCRDITPAQEDRRASITTFVCEVRRCRDAVGRRKNAVFTFHRLEQSDRQIWTRSSPSLSVTRIQIRGRRPA